MTAPTIVDCTLRDGGYYTDWDFAPELVAGYLDAMKAARIDVVELGFRFAANEGFKGAAAFATDEWLRSLVIPEDLRVSVMLNAADLLGPGSIEARLAWLFPESAATSPVRLVRIACHLHEVGPVAPAIDWLAKRGFEVGFNLMQIANRTREDIAALGTAVAHRPVAALYIADSTGSLRPEDTMRFMGWLREVWDGPLGMHAHDNMGLALENTLAAARAGATWLDSTVTGMGRGPGNARTEELAIEAGTMAGRTVPDLVPLMALIRRDFAPLKARHGWGTNPYYYLAGKYGIHPTYVQAMLADARYDEADMLAVIERLARDGGKKFSADALAGAREFYPSEGTGTWAPAERFADREVLLLGTGPGAAAHRAAIEDYVRAARPVVVALNTQSALAPGLIDLRVACHPVRLMADCEVHAALPEPLVTPVSALPEDIRAALGGKKLLDFGLGVTPGRFDFAETHCTLPASLVLAYALAAAASGRARRILMAGFDGYPAGDPRNEETAAILRAFATQSELALIAITPTRHDLESASIYALARETKA